jgi:glycosyltransferase involved in cell wall biosynthesis
MAVRTIPDLARLTASAPTTSRPLEVCVVSSEFLGPIKNGGIATAAGALIDRLTADGHRVTALYSNVERGAPVVVQDTWDHWVATMRQRGVALEFIPHPGNYRDWTQKAWLVKEFLAHRTFDVVYFNEHHGSGYYALAAKRAGIAPFAEQLHCVITHGSLEWVHRLNDQYMNRPSDLTVVVFERRSVEWADIVIAPSRYLLNEYASYGWTLPEQTYHQPYPLLDAEFPATDEQQPIDELVFFGRLETRKGLWLFCEALDRIADTIGGRRVTFLGRMTNFSGASTGALIAARSAGWPFRIRLLTEFDQDQALDYLHRPGRLAVMPSIADNSPCVVYECMERGIPFVTTLGSGAEELVHPDCWPDTMVEPTAAALADRLATLLRDGARSGRPRFDPAENLATWSAWHRAVAAEPGRFVTHGPSDWSGVARQPGQTLIVVVDDGVSPLNLVLDSLRSHVKNFAGLAGLLVLSSRGALLQDFLYAALAIDADPNDAAIVIVGPDDVADAQESIAAADAVFLIDADFELLTPFFLTAVNMLRSGRAAVVSCVSARRQSGRDELVVPDLPHGDAPGVATLMRSLGSGVWAASSAAMEHTFDIFDEEEHTYIPAASIGHAIARRALNQGLPYLFVPVVGGVGTWPDRARWRPRRYSDTLATARDLGLQPSLFASGAPWLAISAFGGAQVRSQRTESGLEALRPGHPVLRSANVPMPQFAASLGRVKLAVQLAASGEISEADMAAVFDDAKRAARFWWSFDLGDRLVKGDVQRMRSGPADGASQAAGAGISERLMALVRGSGTPAEPAPGAGDGADEPAETGLPDRIARLVRVYADSTLLAVRNGWIDVAPGKGDDNAPGLFFVDVPIAGHRRVSARLVGDAGELPLARMRVIDQAYGASIGVAAAAPLPGSNAIAIDLDLKAIFSLVTIALSFSAAGSTSGQRSRVRIQSLEVA